MEMLLLSLLTNMHVNCNYIVDTNVLGSNKMLAIL